MEELSSEGPVPATERAVIGLCHDLNARIGSLSAYIFLLRKRGLLGDFDSPIQEEIDRLTAVVRLLRHIPRNSEAEIAPVGLGDIADVATEIVASHPDGSAQYIVASDSSDGDAIIRYDWTRLLHLVIRAGAWVSRDTNEPVEVELATTRAEGEVGTVLDVRLRDAPEISHTGSPESVAEFLGDALRGPVILLGVEPNSLKFSIRD